jgi:hypothetical protein
VIFAELVLDLARDGLEVRLGGAGADDEKIGQARDVAQIDSDDVLRLFIGREFCAEGG